MTTTLPKLEMHGVFLGTEAVGAGAVSAQQLRGKRYTRLFRDAYIPAGYRITHALRCEAAALVVPDAAVLTGRSAAAILGLDLTRPGDPVEWLIEESLQFGARGMAVKRTLIASTDGSTVNSVAWRPHLGWASTWRGVPTFGRLCPSSTRWLTTVW